MTPAEIRELVEIIDQMLVRLAYPAQAPSRILRADSGAESYR